MDLYFVPAESPIPTRQETEILSNGRGKSIKDILTQEYQKSNEVVSFEEEMQEEVISVFLKSPSGNGNRS